MLVSSNSHSLIVITWKKILNDSLVHSCWGPHLGSRTRYSVLPLKYALWTGAVGAHLVGRCVLYSHRFSRPFDLMNCNGKQMKPKAILLTEAQWCEIIVEFESATNFKGIEALPKTILDINDQFLCSNVQTEAQQIYDVCDDLLRRFNKTLTNRHWMSSVKISCIRGKWLYMTCSNNKVWTLIFVKRTAHLAGMCT